MLGVTFIKVTFVDNGPGPGVDIFGASGSTVPFDCASPLVPVNTILGDIVVVDAPPLPSSKDQCKKGGWLSYGVFENQGDCVSFVATGGTNPPAGSRSRASPPAMSARRNALAVLVAAAAVAVCVSLAASAEAFPSKNGRIAYVKHRFFWTEGGDKDTSSIRFRTSGRSNPDGSGPLPFAAYGEEPRFSPGGGLVAFQDYLARIFIKPIDGSRGRKWRLAPRLGADSFEIDPAWAPFRGRLIFALDGFDNFFLQTIATNGRRMHRLRAGFEPDWSITNRIVFQGAIEDAKIATMAPGGHLRRLRAGSTPRWSPDGRWIVFTRPMARGRSGIADPCGRTGRACPHPGSRPLGRFAGLVAGRSAHCVCAPEPPGNAVKRSW